MYRLCPTYNDDYEKLFLKNDEPHTLERKYVGVKVRKCSEKLDGTCKSDTEI